MTLNRFPSIRDFSFISSSFTKNTIHACSLIRGKISSLILSQRCCCYWTYILTLSRLILHVPCTTQQILIKYIGKYMSNSKHQTWVIFRSLELSRVHVSIDVNGYTSKSGGRLIDWWLILFNVIASRSSLQSIDHH